MNERPKPEQGQDRREDSTAPLNHPPPLSPRDPLEQVATKFMEELRKGRNPQIDDYVAQYPRLGSRIRELFPFVIAMEDWKAHRELQDVKQPEQPSRTPEKLGHCRIIRELGRGGMGVVYEAEEEPLGRRVAIKLLPWRFAKTSRWRAHFQREARIVAQLKHPHIVPVFTFGEDHGQSFFVMKLIEGIGLDKLIQQLAMDPGFVSVDSIARQFRGEQITDDAAKSPDASKPDASKPDARKGIRRYSWPQLGRIALQATSALQYAHEQGTLHRDIKPGNLLMDVHGTTWMADFGLALSGDQARRAGRVPLAGTLRYMAPEQFDGECDARSDVFSLGVTMYQLFTLQPAFAGEDRETVLKAVLDGKPPRPRKLAPTIPLALELILQQSMQRDPAKRFQTAAEMRSALLNVLNPSRNGLGKKMKDWLWTRVSGTKGGRKDD